MKRSYLLFLVLALVLMSCQLLQVVQEEGVHTNQQFLVIEDTNFYWGFGTLIQGRIAKGEIICLRGSVDNGIQNMNLLTGKTFVRTNFKVSYTGGTIPGWVNKADLWETGSDCE